MGSAAAHQAMQQGHDEPLEDGMLAPESTLRRSLLVTLETSGRRRDSVPDCPPARCAGRELDPRVVGDALDLPSRPGRPEVRTITVDREAHRGIDRRPVATEGRQQHCPVLVECGKARHATGDEAAPAAVTGSARSPRAALERRGSLEAR